MRIGTLAALLALAGPAAAQTEPEKLPPLTTPIEDPAVTPAQFVAPGTVPKQPGGTGAVVDPPTPVVRIRVRVPADSPPGDDLKFVITVQNTSQAEAHHVQVRNPLNENATAVKAEPKWDEKLSDPAKQLVWQFGTLKPGESKTIELTLKPKDGAAEVKNLAYVRFEHGEATTTRLNRPGLKVSKLAPKQIVRDEPFTVRVTVENNGKVPAQTVRLVETVDKAAEVEAVTTGAKRTKADANQWAWELGTLMPGQRKVVEYRVTPKSSADALTTSAVEASKGVLEKAESRTQVLVPGLTLKLAGPTGVVQPGQDAQYEIEVRNTGTLPSQNVRISGTVPSDCKPTKKTNGGQEYRDQIVWAIPRIDPGEGFTVRYSLKASTTGARVVTASVEDARKTRAYQELRTHFTGVAALSWQPTLDPVALAVGRQGTFTVRVKNDGGEAAANVRLEVELPDGVKLVQATPKEATANARTLTFPAETIRGYDTKTYTLTYEAVKGGQAYFRAKLHADVLGDNPLTTDKSVEITGRP